MMKKSICFIGLLVLLMFAMSCTKSETSSTAISEEAVVTKFYLHNDSVEGIDDYVFTIDEDSMLIYNYDSIDYGTPIDSLCPMFSPRFSAIYINDSIDYYAASSVYLDFTNDVKLTVVAADEVTSADYTIRVNVHKVDPDTFVWQGVKSEVFAGAAVSAKAVSLGDKLIYMAVVDGKLLVYESENGEEWSVIVSAGLTVDFNSLDLNGLCEMDGKLYLYSDGKLYKSVDGAVWIGTAVSGMDVEKLMFAMSGKLYGVTSDGVLAELNGAEWVEKGELPSKFPVEGGAVLVAESPSGKERVFVVGGIDVGGRFLSSVWSSEDGAYWSELTGGKEQFSPRAYASVVQYGGGLMLFGGMGQIEGSIVDGEVVDDAQLFSKDFGMTWGEPKAKSVMPELYLPRYGHSAIVTSSGYIYLIGGRVSAAGTINDVWRGLNYASLPGFRH